MKIYGEVIDGETRCIHYHSLRDVIAIKFYCCGKYFPCYFCHQKEDHPVKRWPLDKHEMKAILCGVCKHELSIKEYQSAGSCPNCKAHFNPGCSSHHHLYFDIK